MAKISNPSQPDNQITKIEQDLNPEDAAHEILRYMEYTKQCLQRVLDIKHLSIIEGVRLRHIVQQVLNQQKKDIALARGGEIAIGNICDVEVEAAYRWLDELYDIQDIPYMYEVTEGFWPSKIHGQFYTKHEADKLAESLEQKGHDVYVYCDEVAPQFIEYLNRLRDRAHRFFVDELF